MAFYDIKQISPADGEWFSVWATNTPDAEGRHYCAYPVIVWAVAQRIERDVYGDDILGTGAVVGLDASCGGLMGGGQLDWGDHVSDYHLGYVQRQELDSGEWESGAVERIASVAAQRAALRAAKAAAKNGQFAQTT